MIDTGVTSDAGTKRSWISTSASADLGPALNPQAALPDPRQRQAESATSLGHVFAMNRAKSRSIPVAPADRPASDLRASMSRARVRLTLSTDGDLMTPLFPARRCQGSLDKLRKTGGPDQQARPCPSKTACNSAIRSGAPVSNTRNWWCE